MEQIGKVVKKFSSNPLLDCVRFFEVALFTFLTGNADMHLKNFSLIYPFDEMIQLAPAYDLLATRLLISEKDDPEEKQLQNIFKRFAKALPGIKPVIDTPLFPHDKKEEFIALIIERAARIGLV